MNEYCFSYRRKNRIFFKRHKKVIGHNFEEKNNKMVLYFNNGSVQEIVDWTNCEIRLGVDWVLAMKRRQEEKIGQKIPLAFENGD